jgi:hypothetical protein
VVVFDVVLVVVVGGGVVIFYFDFDNDKTVNGNSRDDSVY